jgi:hypothetical protein
MFKDFDDGDGRAVQLATHLFALKACIKSLPLPPSVFCAQCLEIGH